MEQLESSPADFSQVVISALDEVFGALESERFQNDGVAGAMQALASYLEQVRRIRSAAHAGSMPGLQWACALIERNLIALYKQNRQLSSEEFALLSEWPELLASYALNQDDRKIEPLIWHLAARTWPAPLLAADTDELRRLLAGDLCACQPYAETDIYAGLSLLAHTQQAFSAPPGTPLENAPAAQQPSLADRDPAESEGASAALPDARLAVADALDGLILCSMTGAERAFESGQSQEFFSFYACQLQLLSSCLVTLDMPGLAGACDAFVPVMQQRAQQAGGLSAAEHNLCNQFPLLAMDSVADPDSLAALAALMDLVFDPLWEQNQEQNQESKQEPKQQPDQGLSLASGLASYVPQQISLQMLALLAKELGLMQTLLEQDLAAVCAPGLAPEARAQALANYAEALLRIGATAEALGLPALNGVLTELTAQLSGASEALSPAQYAVLTQLPQHLASYLACPSKREHCMGLLALLCDPAWPSALSETACQRWIDALAQVELLEESVQTEYRHLKASAVDVSIALPKDINLELLDGLLQELPLQVASFSAAIERLAAGSGSMFDVEQAKRAAHTLKGAANTVGIAGIANLTHHLEELLIALSAQNSLPGAALASLLTEAADCLEAMSEAVMEAAPAPPQAQDVLQQILDYINSVNSANCPEQASLPDSGVPAAPLESDVSTVPCVPAFVQPDPALTASDEPDASIDRAQPADAAERVDGSEPTAAEGAQMLRVPAPVVDELLRLAGENVISNAQIQERLRQTQKQSKAIQKQDALFQKLIAELENLVDVRGLSAPRHASVQDGDFDPLEFERYSELHTITSQLIEARMDAAQLSGQIDEELQALGELLEVQRRLQMENQHAVIRTRLVQVGTVSARLQRSVRQTCRLSGKQVTLKIIGEATNIDSNMLHELIDPLMHLLRNAVDHGIEAASDRLAAHKPAVGQIELSFAREGNAIVVRCRDDGAGLDYTAIRRSAVQKKLLAADGKASDEELARFILLAGFSTRQTATQTSGRGVGMDAVYARILEMKGSLGLHASAGGGLAVELRLPASLLSEHTLMARIGGKLLAVSSRRITDIHYITQEQISYLGSQPVYRVGDVLHQLHRLDRLLELPSCSDAPAQAGFPLLLIRTDAGMSCAILVQELVDGREVVVKKLGRYVPKTPGTIGAVILGDGSVAPVIDLPELLRARQQSCSATGAVQHPLGAVPPSETSAASPESGAALLRTALIVDDSLSARRASAQIMRDAGYQVRTAIDGLDAVALLEQAVPDVILVDMEMPRMNGLELTSHVRGRASTRHVPVIMISSRSTAKHRQQGDAAGVNAYLVKPFSEDKLLQHVHRLVGV